MKNADARRNSGVCVLADPMSFISNFIILHSNVLLSGEKHDSASVKSKRIRSGLS